jgi:hypothetical protein
MKHGHFSGVFAAAFLSVPFYFIWNALAPTYAYGIPAVYQHLPFWHCMGLFVLIAILRSLLFPWRSFNSWKFNYKGWHRRD